MESNKQNQDGASTSSPQVVQEYVVRIPKTKKRCFNIMRFSHSLKVDVSKWNQMQVKMERENNLKEFKADEDMPKYGAGSEFGREQREESRRKKYGIVAKKYNPEEQPWILKLGGKGGKKFKGIREGGVTENASYYVFTQAADGTFEAFPVEEWYNFSPIQCYKALSAEEAEEEFGRRDKVLNFFSIMVKKRLQNESVDVEDEDESKSGGKKKGKQQKEFKISDMDDWANDSDDSDRDDDEEKPTKKEKPKKGRKKKNKKEKSDDEAVEESDEGDLDDKEVDYITDSSSSGGEQEDEKNNREMKGVEDEDAIRKLDNSDEEEEEEPNKETEEKEETKEKLPVPKPKTKQKKSESKEKGDKDFSGESTSESSDSDFDDNKYNSAMFMQEAKKKKDSDNSTGSSRANTPTRSYGDGKGNQKAHKRKMIDSGASNIKRPKIENQPGSSTLASTLDGINEDAVRRYLARKPMTASELLHKFKSKKTKMSSDQLVTKIAEVLKKMDLVKTNIKGKMYLSLKT